MSSHTVPMWGAKYNPKDQTVTVDFFEGAGNSPEGQRLIEQGKQGAYRILRANVPNNGKRRRYVVLDNHETGWGGLTMLRIGVR